MLKPLRPCSTPRCPGLTRERHCKACAPKHSREKNAAYNLTRPGTTARGYGADWNRFRRWAIANFRLVFCGDRPPGAPVTADSRCLHAVPRRLTLGRTLDHIEPITGRSDPRRLEPTAVQLLCDTCNGAKRQREAQAAKSLTHKEMGGSNPCNGQPLKSLPSSSARGADQRVSGDLR